MCRNIEQNPNKNYPAAIKVQFVAEQFQLCTSKSRHYTQLTIYVAPIIFYHSAACYNALRNNEILHFPHPRYLRNLTESLNFNGNNVQPFLSMTKKLTQRERYVVLQLDKIYVNQAYSYRYGHLYGAEQNTDSNAAKTVQAYLITSAFGRFKQVAVLNINGEELLDLARKAITLVQNSGYVVISG